MNGLPKARPGRRALLDGGDRHRAVVAVVDHQAPAGFAALKTRRQRLEVEGHGIARPAGGAFDQVRVGELHGRELLTTWPYKACASLSCPRSLASVTGDRRTPVRPAPISPTTASITSSIRRAVGDGAAVGVAAVVQAVAQELLEQVAVGAVRFHAVEAGGDGVTRGGAVVGHDARHLVAAQRARRRHGFEAAGGVGLGIRRACVEDTGTMPRAAARRARCGPRARAGSRSCRRRHAPRR